MGKIPKNSRFFWVAALSQACMYINYVYMYIAVAEIKDSDCAPPEGVRMERGTNDTSAW